MEPIAKIAADLGIRTEHLIPTGITKPKYRWMPWPRVGAAHSRAIEPS